MASQSKVYKNIVSGIKSPPAFLGASSVQIAQFDNAGANDPGILVFVRTKKELTRKARQTPDFSYPLHYLMNNLLVLGKVAEDVRKGELRLCPSELMVAAIAGVAEGQNWGTRVTKATATFKVPAVTLGKTSPAKKNLTAAETWEMALMITDWPLLPSSEPPGSVPALQVVHLPDESTGPIREQDLRRIVKVTLGWNYAQLGDPALFASFAKLFRRGLESAETIITY